MKLILDFDEYLVEPLTLGQRLNLGVVVSRVEQDRIDVSWFDPNGKVRTLEGESRAYVTLETLDRA